MAVPFSKPLYPGGPPRRVGPPRRGRPNQSQQNNNNRPTQQREQPAPQQHNQMFPEQTSSHQNGYQHPIERFLYGDGVIQLDRLSRVTRLAFYALFEAWRLLQDLSPNQTRSIAQGQDNQNFGHHNTSTTNISTTNNQAPVQNTIPTRGLTGVEASNTERKTLPDVVIASTQSRNLNSENSNLNFNLSGEPILDQRNITQWHSTPTKKQSGRQDATCSPNKITKYNLDEIWTSPKLNTNITSNDNNTNDENEKSSITKNNQVSSRNRRDSEANHRHLQKNREFIDDQQVRIRNAENTRRSTTRLRRSSFSTSDLPDLVPISERVDDELQYPEFNIMNCDYVGGVKQKFDDDIDDLIEQIDFGKFSPFSGGKDGYTNSPWEKGKRFNDHWDDATDDVDYDKEYDHILSDDKKILSSIVSPNTTLDVYRDSSNCPWSNSGLLLVELASAFEMSYGVAFENDQERQQYELYRRMKADILRNQARYFYGDNDHNMFGLNFFELGKAVLSQALLTGMWFMLKRIKIV